MFTYDIYSLCYLLLSMECRRREFVVNSHELDQSNLIDTILYSETLKNCSFLIKNVLGLLKMFSLKKAQGFISNNNVCM